MVTLHDLCGAHDGAGAFIEALLGYNARRPQWVHRQVEEHLFAEVAHPSVVVWGLAYKGNTRSTKNSMAIRVIRELGDRADVRAYDPVVGAGEMELHVKVVAGRHEALDLRGIRLVQMGRPSRG